MAARFIVFGSRQCLNPVCQSTVTRLLHEPFAPWCFKNPFAILIHLGLVGGRSFRLSRLLVVYSLDQFRLRAYQLT